MCLSYNFSEEIELSALSDEALMKAYALEGQADAFSELYGRYENRLYGFFIKRLALSKRELAPDLFQKTWLKIHQARKTFQPEYKFSAWAFSIALNILRDSLGSRYERTPIDPIEDSAPTATDSESQMIARQDLARIESALDTLPDRQREAIILSEWEGFSARETGDILGIGETAARQLLFRARANLKKTLGWEKKT